MKKRLLSLALVAAMVISLIPATLLTTAQAAENTDAFGIATPKWTAEEQKAAEADLPFGTGSGWTTLFEKNELFFSMGYDNKTRLTGLFDWNGTEGTTTAAIKDKIDNFGQSKLTSKSESYKAVATAAMDLYGTGKKEYVANLALDASGNTLYLYVTDSSNRQVGVVRQVFENVAQLGGMQIHQINGAFSIAAGDFDGDGKDTIVVYVPQTDGNKETQKGKSPFIKEFSFDTYSFTEKSTVAANVLTLLGNTGINVIDKMHNQPMVDLVAEDVDKDGFDELIVTAGMNDVTNNDDKQLQSQVFIYDQLNGQKTDLTPTADGKWNLSYRAQNKCNSDGDLAPGIYIKDAGYKRVVWASSTVGNVITSIGSDVDYPEIVTAGFIDNEQSKTQHINVEGDDRIGVSVVQVTGVKNEETKNVICQYGESFNQVLGSNSWTRGGFYESEDVNGLLQVQAYADRGLGSTEAVFISGTVYRSDREGTKLEGKYTHDGFKSKDDFAPGGRVLTNTTVAAVTAGNFDGNDEGREQLVCVTAMKQSGKNNAYSQVYFYHNEATCNDEGTWTDAYDSKRSGYLTEHKGHFYVSLAALDTDNDSILVKLEEITRDYSKPDVLAILETSPYFAEIEDSFNNSETTYGLSSSKIEGSSNTFGFTRGSSVGYEFESDLTQSGGGFEVAIERAYNWTTAKSSSEEWGIEFRNDTGDNVVVVYRCPVVTYRYVDQNGKKMVVEKVGRPATNMISVDDYNEAAAQYDGLDLVDDNIVKLGEPGNPASYHSSTKGLTNAVQYNGTGAVGSSTSDSSGGWAQYKGSGSMMQYWTGGKEQEKTFSYDLGVSLSVFAKIGGVTASATAGFAYAHEKTHINGSSVTKSGAVSCVDVPGYDFRWKLAAWNCELNGSSVPVIGYLVKDVVAPPSPAEGLTAESVTTDSVTLRWSSGIRPADQYRIYRVLDDTDSTHVLVGAVQGDQTTYTLTGLEPDETYTYVVRGVETVAGKAVESVDSAPITVRTQSKGSNVTLTLSGSSPIDDNILQSTGAAADLSVQVTGTGGNKRSYQWQLLEAGAAGIRHGWLNVDTLDGKTIGTVTGATGGSLTLQDIDESLNGSSLRCVVTVTTTPGDVETYYSPVVTLDLSGLDTTTAISVSGTSVTGNGSIATPYTGMADHTTVTEKPSGSYTYVPATVTDGGKTYAIYQDATNEENPVYVGVYDVVDTENDTVNRTYYAVTKNTDGTFTLGSALTLDDAYQYLTDGGNPYDTSGFTGFDGTSGVPEDVTTTDNVTTRYEKRYVVTSGTTLTEYWFNTSDGQYYKKTEAGQFVLPASQPDKTVDEQGTETLTNADIRIAYYDADGTVILSADGTDGYDHYQVYTAGEGGYTAGASFYRLPGTKLYSGDNEYADSAKLTTVTVQQEVLNTVTTSVAGTQLTLSAIVDPNGGGVVTFTITNTDTGAVTQFTTTSGTGITWTAPKAGLYRIVATAAATATTKSSSAVCYYQADDPTNDYRLTLWQGKQQVTNISYSGNDVSLVLEQRNTNGTWSEVTSDVSYKANDATCSSSYTPGAAGSYTFSAQVDGKTVATAILVVNKVPITVKPTWDKPAGAANTVPAYSDIRLVFTDAQGKQISGLDDYMTVSCALYGSDGAISSGAQSGVYTVTPVYGSDAVKKAEFLSRYSVTINTGSIYYFSDKIAVHFETGENGNVFAYYIDPSGDEFPFSDGSQISMDYGLKFVAEPNAGWSVEKWKVTAGDQDVTSCFSSYIDTLLITSRKMNTLKEAMGSSKTLNVLVTFTNQAHKITYDIATDSLSGSLRAEADNDQLLSGASVANGATVTFTATPTDGKMVEKWTVDGKEYKWDGTDALYRENTLTLKNISADHEVQVSFTDAADTNVIASAVDAAGASYSGATITVTDAKGTPITDLTSVPQSNALTFTAAINSPSSAVVKKWQTSTDGENWTTVTGSGSKDAITIYQHDSKTLYVRVVIAVTQTYTLSWNVDGLASEDADKANLVVMSGNDFLGGNGSLYAANIPVDFTLTLNDAYEVVSWSDNVTADGKTATLSSLTKDTTVTVTVRKKPTVTINYSVVDTNGEEDGGTGGTLTATVNGTALNTNGSARYDQTVTFTATPATGYRVKEWKLNNEVQKTTGNTFNLPLTKDMAENGITVTVQFMPTGNQLMFYSGDNGSIQTVTVNGKSYDFANGLTAAKNAQVVITAAPDTGYEVKAWTVNGKTQEGQTDNTFTYKADGTNGADITVEFQPVEYTVNWTANNGKVKAEGQTGSSAQIRGGATVTFTATPDDGYVFDHWAVNGEKKTDATNASFDWIVPTDVEAGTAYTIRAVFVKTTDTFTVTYNAEGNGTISVPGGENGRVTVASGDSVTFTATPAANYMVKEWQLDGKTIPGTENRLTYELTNVMAGHSVTVVFKAAVLYPVGYGVTGTGGTLTAKANDVSLTLANGAKADVPAGSKLVFTATPESDKMVAQWTVNNIPVTRNNMAELGVTMDHYLSNTLTVENLSKPMNIQVSFDPYTGYTIPTNGTGYTVTDVKRIPNDTTQDNQIRKNGDVSFTISPDSANEYSTISSIKLSNKELLTDDPTDNITVVKNSNGSYTVTITGVQSGFDDLTVTAHKLVIDQGLDKYAIPDSLEAAGITSTKEIQIKLETQMTTASDGKVFYDIALKYRDGTNWVEVTENNFPTNGVDVVLGYPDGTNKNDTFTIVHMLTVAKGDKKPGDLEVLSYTKEDDGLHFHVDSLSPFGVSWTKYVAPAGGGGGGGAIAPAETVVIKDSVNGKVTADNKAAAKGDTVTLTVTPDKGYTLETLLVTDKNGDELKLTEKNGKYTFTMPASNVTVKATFMEDNSMLNFFVDVPADAYFYDAVLWAVENDITSGVDETHFAPNATCTRAQAVTFLWRAAGSPEPESREMTFTDVAEGSYYHDAVLWAVENGITKGTSDTTFSPDATCSRGQIVTFLWRAQESPDADGANPFTDVADDAYYADAVLWAVENGITTGTTDTTFSPSNDCTRAQIVTFLWRALAE